MFFVKKICLASLLIAGVLFLSGCLEDSPLAPEPVVSQKGNGTPVLFMTQSDFESGYFQQMSTISGALSAGFSIYSDASVTSYNGYVYIIEHFGGDNIIKFDPSKSSTEGIIYQKHTGNNWNPQDIEFVSDTKAYISNMNEPKISIFNPTTGSVLSNIDISSYTYLKDSNTTPYATVLQLAGTDLYVMLQRRNGYNPGAPTLLLKINTLTDQITDTIALKYKNGSEMTYFNGALYITNPGSLYVTGDGAVEKVNLADKTVTEIISETALGGNPYMIAHKSGSVFYLTNYIGWKNVSVITLDVATGAVLGKLPNVKDAFGGICYDSTYGTLYVGERDSLETGVRIFKNDVQTGTIIRNAKSLPVTSMCIVR